jgi:triosephosphate isomerase (TIM)
MRKKWIIGNWKMNGSVEANAMLLANIKTQMPQSRVGLQVAVCPSTPYLSQVRVLLSNSQIAMGAQDVSDQKGGAFTGQVSAGMLKEFGVSLVLVGHSERRHGLQETDELVANKAKAAWACGITPVVCVGERLEEREAGQAKAVVLRQLVAILNAMGADAAHLIVAYEPVWAIGTGKTATPQDAQDIHAALRLRLAQSGVEQVPILYGGSVKSDNVKDLLSQRDIDGALVGGAALDAAAFCAIVRAA